MIAVNVLFGLAAGRLSNSYFSLEETLGLTIPVPITPWAMLIDRWFEVFRNGLSFAWYGSYMT